MNATHDPARRSWIESANDPACDFPIQNLPFGVFSAPGDERRRIGAAIGDQVLDVTGCVEEHLLDPVGPEGCCALCAETLNDFLAQGADTWRRARLAIGDLLDADAERLRDDADRRRRLLHAAAEVRMHLPVVIGDYTDFYASLHHATNVGSMFRPDNPLLPNYKNLPVGYHGRASTVVVSGTGIRRPMGQTKADTEELPAFGPCRLLDYELELGFFTGPGNEMGRRIPMQEAAERIFGMCIVNDWSARDIQKWEYQPLGPFNAKNFGTSISPWIVTLEALAPFRIPGPPRAPGDPPILEYLQPVGNMALDITAEVLIASATMRERGLDPMRVSRGNFHDMYWTIAQMLAHHTSTGCAMRPGDLLASGTVSGPTEDARGCLLERTWRGQNPIELPDGTARRFLQDGDEVVMRAWCEKPDGSAARIGFGECRGVIEPVNEG